MAAVLVELPIAGHDPGICIGTGGCDGEGAVINDITAYLAPVYREDVGIDKRSVIDEMAASINLGVVKVVEGAVVGQGTFEIEGTVVVEGVVVIERAGTGESTGTVDGTIIDERAAVVNRAGVEKRAGVGK
ncbi:hypothetical protein [Thalassospira lucentensis]|uniref:hypothetical protein n=1 Tax=Thalassospira lucentensis TaxID=168935 RepID=UPI0023F04D5E|nr:hypothetical protein [Thalassospira lucentensis]